MLSFKKLLSVFSLLLLLSACSDSGTKDPYKDVANPSPTTQPEVLEFFAYFCPHCFRLDPKVDAWKKGLPKSVSFKRVPLTLGNPSGRIYSRIFYMSEHLNVLEKSHYEMFQLFHVKKTPLTSELQMRNFFLALGVTENAYLEALNNPIIDEKIAEAEALAKQFRIISVPGFVVNRAYFTDVTSSGGEKELFKEMSRLLRKKK